MSEEVELQRVTLGGGPTPAARTGRSHSCGASGAFPGDGPLQVRLKGGVYYFTNRLLDTSLLDY